MKSARRYQKGASLWMVMLVLAILAFGSVFGLKLIPMYLNWWKVEKAVSGALQGGVGDASKREITTAIVRRLDVDGIYHMTEKNLGDFMVISKKGRRVRIDIDYEARDTLFGNVFMVTHFTKSVSN
ncbi:MAG: hypothetical protein ACI9DC_005011 [Gammaproteobacteria bacterium]|jgi:hypothetical protein